MLVIVFIRNTMKPAYITDYIKNPDIERGVLGDKLSTVYHDNLEVLLVWHQRVDAAYIDSLPYLKGIIRYGVGFDNVDVEYAASKGIFACNTPAYGTEEVSDTAMAMLLNSARGIGRYDVLCRDYPEGSWQENTLPHLKRFSDLKIGIIGCGRIGSSVALRAKAMRFQVTFYDPFLPRGYEKMLGVSREERLENLLKESDIITIHTPLNEETSGLVDEAFLGRMKRGSTFINTARGGLVSDLDIFYEPLKAGHLSSVALDVLPVEPPGEGKLIRSWRNRESWLDGRLTINPHTAYFSDKAYFEMRHETASNALRVLQGKEPYNILKTPAGDKRELIHSNALAGSI
jgi:C-terminal binding protein